MRTVFFTVVHHVVVHVVEMQENPRNGRDSLHGAVRGVQIKALEISENRWKPTKPTDDEEKIYKAIKGVLNKLTLEKFDKLYQELIAIGIRSLSSPPFPSSYSDPTPPFFSLARQLSLLLDAPALHRARSLSK